MMKYLKYIIIILVLISIIPFSACNIGKSRVESRLKTVQDETPFTIVTPTYLPNGMSSSRLSIGEPSPGFAAREVMIVMEYQGYESDKRIMITEINREVTLALDPYNNPSDTTFYIHSIEISKSEGNFISPEITGIIYSWNIEGINYEVLISGYNEEDCEKVISSMISEE